MAKIEVQNAGPIEGMFEIDLATGPGAYEIRGQRGAGKSTLLSSIDLIAGHKVDITLHDGELSGQASGWGVTAPIGSRKRRKGELELDTIDAEKFSPADLIDPPGKTPETRDKHAIKALAVLSGASATPSIYYELTGGADGFRRMGIKETDDPVLLASRIKEAFDRESRECGRAAAAEAKHAEALELVPEDVDLDKPDDLAILGEQRDESRDKWNRLKTDRTNGIHRDSEIEAARTKLAEVKDSYDGPAANEAVREVARARKAVEHNESAVAEIEAQLAAAREQLREMQHNRTIAEHTLKTAEQHEQAVASLEATANAANEYPEPEEVSQAEGAVVVANAAYDMGVRVRDLKQNRLKAKAHRKAEAEMEKKGVASKNKSLAVFEKLAQSLDTKHIMIEPVDGEPRLVVDHPKRGKTLFDRVNGLSDGERVDYALRELLPHLASPGLLPIPQRVWQDLQPADRKDLHKLAVERGLYLFGAQVDDGELRVAFLGRED